MQSWRADKNKFSSLVNKTKEIEEVSSLKMFKMRFPFTLPSIFFFFIQLVVSFTFQVSAMPLTNAIGLQINLRRKKPSSNIMINDGLERKKKKRL